MFTLKTPSSILKHKTFFLAKSREKMASLLSSPSRFYFTKYRKKPKIQSSKMFAKFGSEDDYKNFKAAVDAASIRYQESLRSDPLFIDPYAGCFLSSVSSQKDLMEQCLMMTAASSPCYYTLATKFIDDKLLSLVSSSEELRQIVLLTDGMDTRPHRLIWPRSSVIYDISPGKVFKVASQRLEGVGAKISKACRLRHVPLESSDIQSTLCSKGFSGNKPSLWVLQGLPLMSLSSFEDILSTVSSLAMEGCIFMGELSGLLLEDELGNMVCTKQEFVEKLLMSHGFQVDVVECVEIARNLQLDSPPGDQKGVLFTAKQLRLSDAQMETWREHFGRLEEEGDEDGFEEL